MSSASSASAGAYAMAATSSPVLPAASHSASTTTAADSFLSFGPEDDATISSALATNDEIQMRLLRLDEALNALWLGEPDPAAKRVHLKSNTDIIEASVFARASKKFDSKTTAAATTAAVGQTLTTVASTPQLRTSLLHSHMTTAALSVLPSSAFVLATQSQRDAEETAIVGAVRNANMHSLRALLLEVHTLRTDNARLTKELAAVHVGEKSERFHSPERARSVNHGAIDLAPRSSRNKLFADDTSLQPLLGISGVGLPNPTTTSPAKLNGLALLKAKARAKAEAAAQQQQQQQTEEEKANSSLGDTAGGKHDESTILHIHDATSPVRRRHDSLSSIGSADSSSAGPSRRSSLPRPRKKRTAVLDGPPYKSRFDNPDGTATMSADEGGYTTDEPTSPFLRHTPSSPALTVITAGVAGFSKSITAPPSPAAHTQKVRPRKAKRRNRTRHSQEKPASPPPEPAPTALTAPLFHSTSSMLPQLPHHLKRKQQSSSVDPMAPSVRSISQPRGSSISLARHGIAMPSHTHSPAALADADRQFSPSRLQLSFDSATSVPNTIAGKNYPPTKMQPYSFNKRLST